MIHEYGMGTSTATARAVTDADIVSDMTRRIRDEEQQSLIYEAERSAIAMITSHRDQLEAFAQALLEREVLERKDIDAIMAGVPHLERRPGSPGLRVVAVSRDDAPDA
jgi:cell division protease FtsH